MKHPPTPHSIRRMAQHTSRLRTTIRVLENLESSRRTNATRLFAELNQITDELIHDRQEMSDAYQELAATTDIGRDADPISS